MRQYGFTYVRDIESIPLALQKQNYSHMTWYSQSFFYTLAGAGYWIFFFYPRVGQGSKVE